jgi:phage terminase small subunit
VPACPAHLSRTAKAEWKRLARQLEILGIISQLNRAAFAAYYQAYGRWVEAERKLAEMPTLIKLPFRCIQTRYGSVPPTRRSSWYRRPPIRLRLRCRLKRPSYCSVTKM